MKSNPILRVVALLVLFTVLLPVTSVSAQFVEVIPPVEMFQLPWEQGKAWVALDGFDNGFKRSRSSPHHYMNGGAVDFAPYNGIKTGVDTSNFWVTAVSAGTVTEVGWCHLKLDHGNGWSSEYQFLANIQVRVGDSVYRNQRLAVIADGLGQPYCLPHVGEGEPHLHFSLRPNMRNVTFAGWLFEYVPILNWTTFTKNGVKLGSYRPLMNLPGLQIVLREPLLWDVLYTGSVDAARYERWPLNLTGATTFTLTATSNTGGLSLLVLLLDSSGSEIARSTTGILETTQPAGNYFVQIQPQVGQGFYSLIARKQEQPLPTGPYVYTEVALSGIDVGGSTLATVGLGNVPAEGYTSTEFTCTYDATLADVSINSATDLFGPDPVMAVNDPQNGTFIVAIAGSKGSRAASSGPAFTYNVKGLQAGQTVLECRARISKGDQVLTSIDYIPAELTIRGSGPQPTPTSVTWPTPTIMPEPTQTPVPDVSSTPEPEESPPPVFTPTLEPTSTPIASPTISPDSPGALTGQVYASKTVTVSLYDNENALATSTVVGSDGAFSLDAPAGVYTVVATASGFLNVQGMASLSPGQVTTLTPVNLLAGDIDGNHVIDQFDALTIGMNYNLASPAAADLNNDGIVNVLDLELLARSYRKTGPSLWQ